jgi:hypothetical protein
MTVTDDGSSVDCKIDELARMNPPIETYHHRERSRQSRDHIISTGDLVVSSPDFLSLLCG